MYEVIPENQFMKINTRKVNIFFKRKKESFGIVNIRCKTLILESVFALILFILLYYNVDIFIHGIHFPSAFKQLTTGSHIRLPLKSV